METGLEEDEHGFEIGVRRSNSEARVLKMQRIPILVDCLVMKVKKFGEKMVLGLNLDMAKLMTTSRITRLRIGSEDTEVADSS